LTLEEVRIVDFEDLAAEKLGETGYRSPLYGFVLVFFTTESVGAVVANPPGLEIQVEEFFERDGLAQRL
jgi:hypothetical protein